MFNFKLQGTHAVGRMDTKELTSKRNGERSELVRERVVKARDFQAIRFTGMEGIYSNSQMSSKLLHSVCKLTEDGRTLLKTAMERLGLSARAYDRNTQSLPDHSRSRFFAGYKNRTSCRSDTISEFG